MAATAASAAGVSTLTVPPGGRIGASASAAVAVAAAEVGTETSEAAAPPRPQLPRPHTLQSCAAALPSDGQLQSGSANRLPWGRQKTHSSHHCCRPQGLDRRDAARRLAAEAYRTPPDAHTAPGRALCGSGSFLSPLSRSSGFSSMSVASSCPTSPVPVVSRPTGRRPRTSSSGTLRRTPGSQTSSTKSCEHTRWRRMQMWLARLWYTIPRVALRRTAPQEDGAVLVRTFT